MIPLSEYPRPQFKRESYISLNGEWEYGVTLTPNINIAFKDTIIVPFSPECEINEKKHNLKPGEYLIYKKVFKLEENFILDQVLLWFLGVDQICEVYLNGKFVGKHIGGFTPFCFDIKPFLEKGNNTLNVIVQDFTDKSYHSRGKQRLRHGGIWYTPQSGIYLPVFLESVPYIKIDDVQFTPDIDNGDIIVKVFSRAEYCNITIEGKEREIPTNEEVRIHLDKLILWDDKNPFLYPVTLKTKNDRVESYFAMRKFSIMEDENGIPRIALNNKPIFLKGILDQGYNKEGLLTPKSYDSYINDINAVKSLGFNMIRKHIKIEIPRWYYECDKRGMIVFQDFVNGGDKYHLSTITFPLFTNLHKKDNHHLLFSRFNKEGRKEALEEFKTTIKYLYNSPCIALWTIFNEGWGQFDAKEVLEELKKIDNSRLYDHASGWHDQKIGNIKSLHVYFKAVKLPKKEKRCIILSEFGGLVLPIEGHYMKGNSVYKKYKTPEELLSAYNNLIERDVIANISKGLSASVYTQLSDVEEETNGFITFDREVIKIHPDRIKEINDKIHL